MTKIRMFVLGMFIAGSVVGTSSLAYAEDIADKQGFCKTQQGNSRCAGGSECSTRGQQELPRGQAKKCD